MGTKKADAKRVAPNPYALGGWRVPMKPRRLPGSGPVVKRTPFGRHHGHDPDKPRYT